MGTKKICILGAGYGGVHAAKLLNRKFKKDDNLEITLINKQPYHTLLTELHEVAGGRVERDSVKVNLEKIFGKSKVKVKLDEITEIDFEKNTLNSPNNRYDYDYLIIGSGSEPAFYNISGAKENSFTIWSYEDAIRIREHIETMFEKASVENNKDKRRKMLTFMVAGAGFTGVETIGEIAEWKNKLCKDYNISKSEVRLIIADMSPKILPILEEKLIRKAEKRLRKLGVEIYTKCPISEVSKDYVIMKDNEKVNCKTLIWSAGVQANKFTKELGLTLGAGGRIVTNEHMQTVDHKNVYVVGDNVDYEDNSNKLPQIVETALQTAETAVENIKNDIDGKSKIAHKSNYHGLMVSIGSRYAVASVGGMKLSGFFAMAVKHLVNLHYLFGVGGFNLIWSYLMHEIFHIKEKRSLLGEHFSYNTPNFWLVPLRVFLGAHWLIEGIKKIQDGWLDPGNIFIIQTEVSGASETADAAANAVEPLLSSPPAIYQWFMDTFVEKVAYPMQAMVVITEVAIGLALIAGLFTMISAIVSLFLTFNFIISAMADASILWYSFSSIALIGGAGRTFGLDYYVMPWIKEKWNKTKLARKFYVYID